MRDQAQVNVWAEVWVKVWAQVRAQVRANVRAMTDDVARWIRASIEQNGVFRGGAEHIVEWVNTLMQRNVMMANLSENVDMTVGPLLLCFLDNFVPESTEVMLQS